MEWELLGNSKFFSTIRKYSSPFKEGDIYNIYMNGKFLYKAELVKNTIAPFGKIPKMIVIIDTGYSYTEAEGIFINLLKAGDRENLKTILTCTLLLKKIK